jgi:hypothetical protein
VLFHGLSLLGSREHGHVGTRCPGCAWHRSIVGATFLTFRAHEHAERQRTAQWVNLGFAVLYLIPAGAFVVLVFLGRLHPVMLIAAGVLIGDALLRIHAMA